jgi:hypothetical protein
MMRKKLVKFPARKSPKQELFLRAFSKCGIVSLAARQAKINKATHYKWLKDDPSYGERFAQGQETAIEYLEELLLRQAEGGNIAAIIFALKAARPEKYRDNYRVELTGRDGGPISTATVGGVDHYLHLSDEQLERIAASGLEDVELAPATATALDCPEANGRLRIEGPALNGDGDLDDSDDLDGSSV